MHYYFKGLISLELLKVIEDKIDRFQWKTKTLNVRIMYIFYPFIFVLIPFINVRALIQYIAINNFVSYFFSIKIIINIDKYWNFNAWFCIRVE